MDVVMSLTHRLLSGSQENPLDEPLKLYLVLLDTERVTGLCGRAGGVGGWWSLPFQPETRKGQEALNQDPGYFC